jgi:hypothetical protein
MNICPFKLELNKTIVIVIVVCYWVDAQFIALPVI